MIDSNIKFVDFSHQNNELSISRYIVKKAEIEELDVALELKILKRYQADFDKSQQKLNLLLAKHH